MALCNGCGGVVGRDCYNPQECEEICRSKAEQYDIACAEGQELAEMLELAWGIIANAHGGDWSSATTEWQQAAARWRDRYMPMFHPQENSNG